MQAARSRWRWCLTRARGIFSANSHLYAGSRQFAGVGADAGFGFFNSAAQLRRGIGINQNLDSSTSNSLGVLPVGRDNLFLGDGEIEFGSLGQPNGLTCTVTGSGTSTWLFRVVAKDAVGRRSLGSYAVSCFNAAATLNATNYVTISHPGVPGAASYDYVARDPGNNSQFKLMLNSTATSANIQSTPAAPWDYVIPKYNETANIKLRAYDTTWWLGGFLRGYSDSGTTQKWSIDSATGNAAFNQVSIAGAALTSVHGNSGKVATVAGTTSNSNIAKFDATGNLIDGGVGGGGGDDLSNASESLLFTADNTYDIGASAANRPRHIYVASALRPANGSSTAPSYSFSGATGVGFYYNSSVGGPTTNTALGVAGNLSIANAALAWNSGDNFSGSWDLWLRRDAANILAQRNGTSAQVFRLYNTFTDSSNYERLNISWSSNAAHINTGAAGTGSPRSLFLGVGAAEWKIDSSGTLSAATDNTVDIGASGANRPRRGYFGTEVVTPKLSGITDASVVASLNADMVDGKHAGDFAKMLDYQKTAADITGDGTDKDLYSFSIPAGAMAAGKGVRVKVWWRCSTCTSASKTFKWTYGASSLSYSSTTSTATAVSYTSVTVMNDPGATNAQQMMSEVLTLGSTAAAAPAAFGTASEDSTAAVTVKFQFNAPSSETFTPRAWLVEKLD